MKNFPFKLRLIGFLCLALAFMVLYGSLFTSKDNQTVHIVLRYDDYSTGSSVEIEQKFMDLIDHHQISCSFGVIPFQIKADYPEGEILTPLSESKVQMIQNYVNEGSIEICQHGYIHELNSASISSTEFKGLPAEEQLFRIRNAKNYLEDAFGQEVKTFIPPWNTYDRGTLKVLWEMGFSAISADNNQLCEGSQVSYYIPYTATMVDMERVLANHTLPAGKHEPVMILMIHDYDFVEIDEEQSITDMASFEKLMASVIQKGWEVKSIREATTSPGEFGPSAYSWNDKKNKLIMHLSLLTDTSQLFSRVPDLKAFYLSGFQVFKLLVMVIIYYLLVLFLVVEFIMLGLQLVSFPWKVFRILQISLSILFVIALGAFLQDDLVIGSSEILILELLLGSLVGLSLKKIKTKPIKK